MQKNIHLIIESDYDTISKKSAEIFAKELREKPQGVFGFATGGTPEGMYKELVRMHKQDGLDFSKAVSFNLDEYHPMPKDNNQSYNYFMFDKLFSHVNIKPENVNLPNGEAVDVELECRNYEERIQIAGGIDLQVLGIGMNGHIGFNEPAESFSANTQYIALTEVTIESNARFFDDPTEVPRHALTMGIRSIMMARKIIMVVSGSAKSSILRDALNGPITPLVPASALQLHPSVIVVADKEAAGLL